MRTIIRRTVLTALALAFLGFTAASAEVQRKSFDVGAGGKLVVDTDIGSIDLRSGGSSVEIEVEATGPRAEELELDFDQSGDTVTVRGDFPKNRSWSRGPKIKFTITVPRQFDVELETSGGSIKVSDLDGEVRAKTSGGSLSFGDISGPVWGRTSGGSIVLAGTLGDADVETSGGSIKIGNVDGQVRAHTSGGSILIDRARGTVVARTSGGSIKVDEVMGAIDASTSGGSVEAYISEQPAEDCKLSTSGGGVTVYLADGIGVELDAHSSGGRVSSDFEVSGGNRTKTSLSGAIHGGGPTLELRSSGGGVRLARR